MSAEVQDLAVRYGAAWAAHDLDAIMALHTEDTVFLCTGDAEPAVGLAAAREAFAGAMAPFAFRRLALSGTRGDPESRFPRVSHSVSLVELTGALSTSGRVASALIAWRGRRC